MLFKHQQDIINKDPNKFGLFWGTGTGKTLTSLCLARGITLVITTKTVRDAKVWENNKTKFSELGIDFSKIKSLEVISKEDLKKNYDKISQKQINTLIVDEAENCLGVQPNTMSRNREVKYKSSEIFEKLHQLVRTHNIERIYLVTATISKSPLCVFGAGIILGKDWNYFDFREQFYSQVPFNNYTIWKKKTSTEVEEILIKKIREIGETKRLQDIEDIPEQTHKTIYVEMTKSQLDKAKELPELYPVNPISQIQKLHQIENGFFHRGEYGEDIILGDNKIEKIKEIADENKRIIVFCKFTQQIKTYLKLLKEKGYNTYSLTGETKDREALFDKLEKTDKYVLLVQTQISSGWELTNCDTMVFASQSYSVRDNTQAIGRILRANNLKKNLYVTLLNIKQYKRVSNQTQKAYLFSTDMAINQCIIKNQDFDEKLYGEGVSMEGGERL